MKTNNKSGTVLFVAIAVILALSAISLTTYKMMVRESHIHSNQISNVRSLYYADAGVKYVKRQLETDLENNPNKTLDELVYGLTIPAPNDYAFDDVNDFQVIVPEIQVRFTVTGRFNLANTTIEASLRRIQAADIGVYGDSQVYMFPNTKIYAYDSRVHPNPSASSIADGGSAGSNGYIELKPGAFLDGSILLGVDDNGNQASANAQTEYEIVESDQPIDTDPLGLFDGGLGDELAQYYVTNSNNTCALIKNGVLKLDGHETGTLKSGVYYLSKIELKSSSQLNIEPDNGPVRVFITDSVRLWPKTTINNSGSPLDFQIFSTSSKDIKILPKNDFSGIIYAPRGDVLLFPNGDFNGTVWGNNVYLNPKGKINIDVAALESMLTNKLVIKHWKELRSE